MCASSNPRHADDFAASDVVIDLRRSAESHDGSDQEAAQANEALTPDALADSVRDVAGPRSDYDNCTLSVTGNMAVRPQRQAGGPQGLASAAAQGGVAWLVAASREERDVLLLLLRARVAPTRVWLGVCRGHALRCESRSNLRLRSFCQERTSQASHRELIDAFVSERSRWMRDHADASEALSRSYGEGSDDDVSDAALLLYVSLMQMIALSTKVGAAASGDEFRGARAAVVALQSIDTYSRRVAEAMHSVLSAAATSERDSLMGELVNAVIGCWDTLVDVEETLRKIASLGATTDATQESLQTSEAEIRELSLSASYAEQRLALQQRVTMQHNVVLAQPSDRRQDNPFKASFRVDIACSFAAAKAGSPRYERIVDELLSTDATNDLQPVAVTSVSGEGGAGKTTTCALALRDARVRRRFKDGVFGFEIGLDAQESDMIKKVASIVKDCQGFATAQSILCMTEIEDVAREARQFFTDRCILLYLDNVWPDSRGLEDLMSVASGRGSCVLFSTRSTTLAEDYTDRVVELGTLRLEVAEEKAAAECIFYKHLGQQRKHRWCTAANVNEALALSRGLPIAIATAAALIRNKLGHGITTDVLGQVSANLQSPPRSSSRNLKHMGLFVAMTESLEFLDRQRATTGDADRGSRGLMTRRYASLHALDRSEDRIDKSILSILWNTSIDDAEVTVGEFFSFGLVRLATPGAATSEEDNDNRCSNTLTLHDLQVEYSSHVAGSGRHGITVEEVHETAVRGMFEDNVDIDALRAHDFVKRCEELCKNDQRGKDSVGRYVVSNLVRHLIGSLWPHNASRRWPTIRGLLSDARWLMLWQGVDGWSYVCNGYTAIRDVLSGKEGLLEVVPDAEVEAIVEVGRAAQTVPVASRSLPGEAEVKKAAVEMYFRLYGTWWFGIEGPSRAVVLRALCGLCVVAGRWWMRPMVACHDPHVRDRRLCTTFAASRSGVTGCALIGSNGHVVIGSSDGVVRVHDGVGAVVAQHQKHSDCVNGVCLGRPRRDTEFRVFSVADDCTLVRWDVSLPTATGGVATAVEPMVVASTETNLRAVACSDDASVVAAGGKNRAVYVWVLGGGDSQSAEVSKFEAREHTNRVNCVAVSSDGATVLSGSNDGTCRMWAVADVLRGGAPLSSQAVLGDRSQRRDSVLSCAFAREERVTVTGHRSGAVRFWSVVEATLLGEVDLLSDWVQSLAVIGRARDEVAAGTDCGIVHVVRVSDRAVTAQLGREDRDWVNALSASRDDRRIVVCGHDSGQVKIWDTMCNADGGATDASTFAHPQPPRHSYGVIAVSTSGCGHFVVSGGYDKMVRCCRTNTGRELWTWDCGSSVWCVCVSADAAHVACGCEDGTVLVLEMANGEVVHSWKHGISVFSVCIHELGDDLVWSGHENGEVIAWSRGTRIPTHRVQGLRGDRVEALGVAAGGKCVYSRERKGRTARIEISDDGGTNVTTVVDLSSPLPIRSPSNAFVERTAQGFRKGGYECKYSRVRHAHGGKVYEVTTTARGSTRILNMKLHLPGCEEIGILTPAFKHDIVAIDLSFLAAADGSCSFAQVVCGLWDGNVFVLRQPLAEGNQHWHPAESLH